MASTDRIAAHAVIEALLSEPYGFDFFQALRLIECLHRDKPRLGTSRRAGEDPVRLAQAPEMDFAPATLASFDPGEAGHPPRLSVRFLGLFGPNGPLPLHLTEYARERLRHHNDRTFARFADVFHHRLLSLFYRAWADSRPTVARDRPESDRFSVYIGSLFGIGMPAFRARDAIPDEAKLYFAGHFASQARHPDGLREIITDFFRIEADILEFVGEWMAIAAEDQTRLGLALRTGTLGESTVVGARVWGCQHKFRVVLGPLSLDSYLAFLPGGRSLEELLALVRHYVGDELVWDVNLILRQNEVPALKLDGGGRLGWTTWLGEREGRGDADDLRLNPFFHASLSKV
jgi:type VI secretion system protein ImpH